MKLRRTYRSLITVSLLLASASVFLSVWLFTGLREVSIEGCKRQNSLRHELNVTLVSFHQRPRFKLVDCSSAYSLRRPF